jgi:GrpB-like predicted nucleotidyltransferase (UPF0157 family)
MKAADEPVKICDYDRAWADRFAALAARAREALGETLVTIEHVGSTAVPGLAAKPIVDLDVVVRRGRLTEGIARLETIGYTPEGDGGIPGREAFKPPSGEPRHHLYLMEQGAAELERHLAFRDALRADSTLCERYSALKRELASRHGGDRQRYSDGKTAFIAAVLRDASRDAGSDAGGGEPPAPRVITS